MVQIFDSLLWAANAQKEAVIQAPGRFHFHKVPLASTVLSSELKEGMYLIDGVLNDSFVKVFRGKRSRYNTVEGARTTPADDEAGWRHSIAVIDGRICEREFEMSANWLWLDAIRGATPDPTQGYFRTRAKASNPTRGSHALSLLCTILMDAMREDLWLGRKDPQGLPHLSLLCRHGRLQGRVQGPVRVMRGEWPRALRIADEQMPHTCKGIGGSPETNLPGAPEG